MKKNILLVANPVSGAVDKSVFIDAVATYATKENLNIILYKTTGQDDVSKIRALYKINKPKRIIIIGGDGTIKMVADATEDKDVILGILPAGSSNGLAVNLDLMRTLEDNLDIAFHNRYIEMDTIVINGEKCFHLSDLGLNAELVKNYEKSKIHGKWGYFLQSINTLLDIEVPFKVTIIANNQIIESEARMVVVANSKKYGTGIVINPGGIMNDGMFELVILKNLDLYIFGEFIMGNTPLNPDDFEIISTDEAIIKTNFPVNFQMDGEYCGFESVLKISISPNKIKVAIP
ncbi:diacylglycerol/lipid kinase family protein [Flavobacterium franklandianum]|uniref:Diacylglycerol kinase n=1 Tax=Flavobacterium franklandianum TaxID=2594430 RepID=A0A553CQN8_9FLAO|nr:diacylglycerol kinase family protein [Flavobacterium franklandianum]TRX22860.1 diacylglycerol kinase [Flavobacterium franklandianum]